MATDPTDADQPILKLNINDQYTNANDPSDADQQALNKNKNDQYIKAVYIIQKHFRQYLKRKAENSVKGPSKSADIYNSQEVLNAILLIQRQFRRLLLNKKSNNNKELKKTNTESYNSVKYLKAALIIQRYIRQYFKKKKSAKEAKVTGPTAEKKSTKEALPKVTDFTAENNVSLATAAFVIQRAFRRMVKVRRAKRHIKADLEQCDEMNDNASEAASYTSASTALMSTESVGEHDFGSPNYEEGVHQQTIKEDEEVENDNTNIKRKYGSESMKTSQKSTDFNEEAEGGNENENEQKTRLLISQHHVKISS
ncbi:uncharacterized protein LOC115483700 [Drosophila hydei]|uniref:Uncharacterized protein LOC115483700 n=1 Tax=Drosophila hydei TaxID=7224 RepID=A0A6J2SUY6_DROHY|nr:uncharacterized protein LOC115483700 [Drosophila hydei]